MSATPIPRTMMMSIYGDMDISKITEKPSFRKKIITLSKPEKKIDDLWFYLKIQFMNKNEIFLSLQIVLVFLKLAGSVFIIFLRKIN